MSEKVETQYRALKLMLALPVFIRKTLFKEEDIVVRGSPLDPHTRSTIFIQKMQKRPSLDEIGREHGVEVARAAYRHFYKMGALEGAKANVTFEDVTVPGEMGDLPARLYTPTEQKSDGLLLYIHGGGFTIGDIEAYDNFNRYLCEYLGVKLLFPEYRLAPEHKNPAAIKDTIAYTEALPDLAQRYRFNLDNIIIGGDSAGGMLTVIAGHEAARAGIKIKGLWPLFPGLDFSQDYASAEDYGIGFGLSKTMMEWFNGCFLSGEEDRAGPYVSPINLPELSKLPSTLLRIAEFDPLADQARAFAKKVEPMGVDLEVRTAKGLVHGYTNMFSILPAAKRALHEDLDWVKAKLAG